MNKTPEAPKVDKKPKTTERTLRYVFKSDEKIDLGAKLGATLSEAAQIEADLDRIKGEFKGKTLAAQAQINSLRDKINSGYELRLIKCVIEMDNPKPGMASIFRTDTEECIETRDMTEAEKQGELDIVLEPQAGGKEMGVDGKIKGK